MKTTMDSGKTLATAALCLTFWAALVLLLLFSHEELGDKAIATPIASEIITKTPDTTSIPLPATTLQPEEPAGLLYHEISGVLLKGETLVQAMKRVNIDDSVRTEFIQGFADSLDFRLLQPGDRFTVELNRDNLLVRAVYTSGPLNIHTLERGGDGVLQAAMQPVSLEYRLERIAGVIDSSLYAAFAGLGEEPRLIQAYADIFASKIDFNTETRCGDTFDLLVEKYFKDGAFVGYGRILVGRYQNGDHAYEGYHYGSENTPNGYFDRNGEALGTWFIRSPIPFGRVTSRFTLRRRHPIDGVVRPHLGVDLAAPVGTPVMATADGRVDYIGRRGGFGKTVILRHNGGYKTYYGHLSRYPKGLAKGDLVSQKDIIGYVGSTGLSTGPHLDYRIQYNGEFRNPFGIKFKAKTVLQDEELELFHREMDQISELFNRDQAVKTLQVKTVVLSQENRISFL